VKEFLSREGVNYQEKNVQIDRNAAQEMVNLTGQMGVPVTTIAGEVIIGFNQPALKQAVSKLRQSGVKLGAQIADAAKLAGKAGALVGEVKIGSLAEKTGLTQGDVIVEVAGHKINNAQDLATTLKELKTSGAEVKIWRNQQEKSLFLSQ
jgi:glutaredoxin